MRAVHSKLNSIPKSDENTGVYKVVEDTVEGECEVLYDVTPLPKYVLRRMPYLAPQPQLAGQGQFIEIMKTKNFTSCSQRPGYHFGLTGMSDWEPTTNKMSNFLSRSSVSRVILSGSLKSYTIQSSVTTNKVILSPEVYNTQKGEVVSRLNLTLSSVHSASGNAQGPQNPQTLNSLVYDYNSPGTTDEIARSKWDQRTTTKTEKFLSFFKKLRFGRSLNQHNHKNYPHDESEDGVQEMFSEEWHQSTPSMTAAPESPFLPYFIGNSGHSIQHDKNVDVNQVVKKLSSEIGQHLQVKAEIPKENTLARFTILTRVIRTMSLDQLEKATEELYTPGDQNAGSNPRRNAWMAYRDAVVQAGTGPALKTIVNFVTTKKITGEEAAQVVGSLAETARYPTSEYINTFFVRIHFYFIAIYKQFMKFFKNKFFVFICNLGIS